MSLLHQGISFLRHLGRAGDAHAVHSPFLFELYLRVERAAKPRLTGKPWLADAQKQAAIEALWKDIERERKRLLASQEMLAITDLGAGSLVSRARERRLGSIARSGLLPRSWGRRLAALRYSLPAGPVLELGTSLGITTSYLASVSKEHPVVTLEGCPNTLNEARKVWAKLGLQDRIRPILGDIDETMVEAVQQGPFSLVVLDANHRSGPVRRYFEQILPYLHPEGCIVLDDIYWTPDMTAAWQALASDARVRQSVDLYRQGWLFFRPGQARERFVLRALG